MSRYSYMVGRVIFTVLDEIPSGTVEPRGGPFQGKGPQPTTKQLQRQVEAGRVEWWIRSGVIGVRDIGGRVRDDFTAYGGATQYKTLRAAREAFDKAKERV